VAKDSARRRWLALLSDFLSTGFLQILAVLLAVLILAGSGVWLFERKRNPEQFGGPAPQGVGAGVWWAAVTLTTVGYGDKVPTTLGGRILALFWFFAGIFILAAFTGHITASLTVYHFRSQIRGPNDLAIHRVAALADGTSEVYLRDHHVKIRIYPSEDAALRAVAAGNITALVAPEPMLKYLARGEWNERVELLPFTVDRQNYTFALPNGSPRREPLNRAVLSLLSRPIWLEIRDRYVGE